MAWCESQRRGCYVTAVLARNKRLERASWAKSRWKRHRVAQKLSSSPDQVGNRCWLMATSGYRTIASPGPRWNVNGVIGKAEYLVAEAKANPNVLIALMQLLMPPCRSIAQRFRTIELY